MTEVATQVDDTSKDWELPDFSTSAIALQSVCDKQGKMNYAVRKWIVTPEVLVKMTKARAIELVSVAGRFVPMFMGREVIPKSK